MCVSNLTGKNLKNVKDSAASDNLLKCNSTIEFNQFDTFTADVSKFNILGKENLFSLISNFIIVIP